MRDDDSDQITPTWLTPLLSLLVTDLTPPLLITGDLVTTSPGSPLELVLLRLSDTSSSPFSRPSSLKSISSPRSHWALILRLMLLKHNHDDDVIIPDMYGEAANSKEELLVFIETETHDFLFPFVPSSSPNLLISVSLSIASSLCFLRRDFHPSRF